MVAGKAIVAGISAVSLVTLLSGIGYHFKPYLLGDDDVELSDAESQGAIAGRFVAIPAQTYYKEFEHYLDLGKCPSTKGEHGNNVPCSLVFTGTEVFIPKGKTTVDVTRVETSEDILNHIMGGVGVTVGALGLVSVTPKIKVAVTTKTDSKSLNLMSSYEVNLGVHTLQHPKPPPASSAVQQALYLSEIEYGGNEVFLVTLEFETVKTKTEVEVSVTIKIWFITISLKVKHVSESVQSKVKCRVQFISSWRPKKNVDEKYDSAKDCLPEVQRVEALYMQGPALLREYRNDLKKQKELHYMYYFSSWKQSPYVDNFNLAVINNDLGTLTEQATELQAVIHRINSLTPPPQDVLNWNRTTLSVVERELTTGLKNYHTLKQKDRDTLRNKYGSDKAPLYYTRMLNEMLSKQRNIQ